MDTPETLKSRLYRLETVHEEDTWVQKCQGYPIFKKQDSIFKLRYYSLPNRQLFYEIVVNSNIKFDKNQNGVEWIQIREGEIMAISFKEPFSANAFWKMIDQYQKRYQVTVPAAVGTHFYFEYRVPDPTVDNLNQFLAQLERIPENQRHERLTSILLTKRQFLPHLYTVLRKLQAAEVPDLTKLEMMFKIMKIIFNSSNEELLVELVMDESFYSVLGALQYDPNFRNARPKHRDYMQNKVKMISVVPFKNTDLLNLCIITQRIEYLRECVLLPYLNDYSFAYTSIIIRNNYKRIIAQIFNPKKKQFINDLFDHLRKQDVMAYKLLREIFRIGKNISAQDFYLHLAERDFFDIMIKNMRDLKQLQQSQQQAANTTIAQSQSLQIPSSSQPSQSPSTSPSQNQSQTPALTQPQPQQKPKKKKKPEQISQCVDICIQILEQFMEYEPQHFKMHCVSESQTVSKYPTLTFLLDHYEFASNDTKLQNILRILISDKQQSTIKSITHQKILQKLLASASSSSPLSSLQKWLPLLPKILTPISTLVDNSLQPLLDLLLSNLALGPKQHQINMLNALKILINSYIEDEQRVNQVLMPRLEKFVQYWIKEKGRRGIRVSVFESIWKARGLKTFVQAIIAQLEALDNPLFAVTIRILKGFLTREDVQLPANLKRERSQQLQDDQCFQKIQKKIKID